jgi:hypothetical protein
MSSTSRTICGVISRRRRRSSRRGSRRGGLSCVLDKGALGRQAGVGALRHDACVDDPQGTPK